MPLISVLTLLGGGVTARGSRPEVGQASAGAEGDRMINLSIPKDEHGLKPRITVIGIGGAGGDAVNNMIRPNLIGCEFVVCNTDPQSLQQTAAPRKIQPGGRGNVRL